jgi:hypothetical protein
MLRTYIKRFLSLDERRLRDDGFSDFILLFKCRQQIIQKYVDKQALEIYKH